MHRLCLFPFTKRLVVVIGIGVIKWNFISSFDLYSYRFFFQMKMIFFVPRTQILKKAIA